MTLRLITFDITGTLLALKESVGYQYAKVGSRYGINVPPDSLTKNFYIVFKRLLVEHPNFGESDIGWSEWWKKLVFQTFQSSLSEKSSLHLQPESFDKISSDLIEIYSTKECWKLADGAKDLLDNLSRKNVRLGVISNYDPRLKNILKDLNIQKYFNFVMTSYEAKCQKPDAGIFKAVENMNMDLEKSEILHIGDNPKLDFIGAKNAGWNALLITEDIKKITENFPAVEQEWVVNNIGEIYHKLDCKYELGLAL